MAESPTLDAVVDEVVHGRAAPQLRRAAARGALPLPRATLVRLYVALRADEDEAIRAEAVRSLEGLDNEAVLEVLADATCTAEVLEYYATDATRDEKLAERIAFHRAVPDAALTTLAAGGNARVIDLVLTNQERLLRHPDLLNRLSVNPALRPDQRGKILELLDRVSRAHTRAMEGHTGARAEGDLEITPEIEETARLLDIDVGELFAASEIVDGEEFERSQDPSVRSAYARILTLNPVQKAILAMRGGREERMILIRDSNKIVALSVLRNGRLTEDDVEAYARMRSVSSEVLRTIGNNREWTKNRLVVQALVLNPRTPQGISTNHIGRLQNSELKRLLGNHDVPELVRRMARRTLDLRTQRTPDKR